MVPFSGWCRLRRFTGYRRRRRMVHRLSVRLRVRRTRFRRNVRSGWTLLRLLEETVLLRTKLILYRNIESLPLVLTRVGVVPRLFARLTKRKLSLLLQFGANTPRTTGRRLTLARRGTIVGRVTFRTTRPRLRVVRSRWRTLVLTAMTLRRSTIGVTALPR